MHDVPSNVALSLYDFLRDTDLLEYHDKLKSVLKLRHAGDLAFCEERDFNRVGMSRPEQKRLQLEYARRFPTAAASTTTAAFSTSASSSLVVKLRKKMFGGGARDSASACDSGVDGCDEALPSAASSSNDERTTSSNCHSSSSAANGCSEHHQHVIPAEHISLCKELGRGEFGCVYQAAWHYRQSTNGAENAITDALTDDVLQVAVKRVLPEKLVSNPSSFLQEAAIMTRMRHPNVVRLYGVVLDTKAVMLVSELAPCGSLLECLQCPAWREPFPVDTLCDFALQIAQGMRYLAAQRLIHRDLAARNILVASPKKVKISDFGLSRSLGVGEDYYRSSGDVTAGSHLRLPVAWCAPEAIKFLRFTTASDVWSYGVTLWEMFTYGKIPWANMTGVQILMAVDAERRILDWPDACPDEFYTLMRTCWAHDASARPTFEAICERLPDIMPQLLMVVADSTNMADWSYLQYKRGDIIVLLRKYFLASECGSSRSQSRSSSRASQDKERDNMWLGALKRGGGLVGLFRPDETVAYIGGEYYNNASAPIMSASASGDVISSANNNSNSMATSTSSLFQSANKNAKKSKVLGKLIGGHDSSGNKERRKLLISQPQGELRHTGHLGVDGHGFGLLNADKNEFSKSVGSTSSQLNASSSIPSVVSSTANLFVNTATSTPLMLSPTSAKTTTTASIASASACTFGCLPSVSATSNAADEHADIGERVESRAPPRPSTAAPRRAAPLTTRSRLANDKSESCSAAQQIGAISPPTLPPKTYRRLATEKNESTLTVDKMKADEAELDEHLTMLKAEAEKQPNKKGKTSETKSTSPTTTTATNSDDKCDEKSLGEPGGSLDKILYKLRRDISDFSLSTVHDYSDKRPLLESDRNRSCSMPQKPAELDGDNDKSLKNANQRRPLPRAGSNGDNTVRAMTPEECEKWREQVVSAHKKAAKSLERAIDSEQKKSAKSQRNDERDEAERFGDSKPNGIFSAKTHLTMEEKRNKESKDLTALRGPFTAKFLSNEQSNEGWSEEARAAYKLLVQVGDGLRLTTAFPNDKPENVNEFNAQKTIEYINPKIIDNNCAVDRSSVDQINTINHKRNGQITPTSYCNNAATKNPPTYCNDNSAKAPAEPVERYLNDEADSSSKFDYLNTEQPNNKFPLEADYISALMRSSMKLRSTSSDNNISRASEIGEVGIREHDNKLSPVAAKISQHYCNSNTLPLKSHSNTRQLPPAVPPKPKRQNIGQN